MHRLNHIASYQHQVPAPVNTPVEQNGSTPFWSPSPANGHEDTAVVVDQPSDVQGTMDEWDLFDDIDFDFTEGLGSAFARKVTRAPGATFNPDEPVQSIEQTPTPDTRRG